MMMVLTIMMTAVVVLIQVKLTGASNFFVGVLEPRALFQELSENPAASYGGASDEVQECTRMSNALQYWLTKGMFEEI